jgi:hypothetical protein
MTSDGRGSSAGNATDGYSTEVRNEGRRAELRAHTWATAPAYPCTDWIVEVWLHNRSQRDLRHVTLKFTVTAKIEASAPGPYGFAGAFSTLEAVNGSATKAQVFSKPGSDAKEGQVTLENIPRDQWALVGTWTISIVFTDLQVGGRKSDGYAELSIQGTEP